ncbi:MAG: MFS transporter [Sulfolobaceae archaeon]
MLSIVSIFVNTVFFSFLIIFPLYAQNLGAPTYTIGLLVVNYVIVRIIIQPITGFLFDIKNKYNILLLGLILYLIAFIIYDFIEIWQYLFLVRLIEGIGTSFLRPSLIAYIMTISKEDEYRKAFGLYNSLSYISTTIGPLIGSLLYTFNHKIFFLFVNIILLFSLIILFSLKNYIKVYNINMMNNNINFQNLKNISILIVLLGNFFEYIGLGIFQIVFPLFVVDILDLNASYVGITYTMIGIGNILASQLWGNYGKNLHEFLIIGANLIISSILILFYLSKNIFVIILIAFINAILINALYTLWPAYIGRRVSIKGSAVGIISASQDLGSIIGYAISGYLYDASYTLPFYFDSIFVLISGITYLFGYLKEKKS